MKIEPFPKGKTIPFLFYRRFEQDPEEVAFYHKELGIYRAIQWKEYWREVEEFFLGLSELGIKRGDRVALMGDPCPEFFYADLAVLSAGAISFGVYADSTPEEATYTLKRTEAKLIVAAGQENVDKILPSIDQFPDLRIIATGKRPVVEGQCSRLVSFSDVQGLGKRRRAMEVEPLSQAIQQTTPEDAAIIVFTSGTTGSPKPVAFSHQSIVSFLDAIGDIFPAFRTHEQRAVCHESFAHPLERCLSIYFPLLYDFRPHIGEANGSLQETLYEVQPTFLHGTPRTWKKLASRIVVAIEGSSWPKRLSYRWAMKIGEGYMQTRRKEKKVPFLSHLLRWIAEQISFRHLRHQLGFSKMRYALSFGAPLPPSVQDLWQTWGVDLVNSYGLTEFLGIVCSQLPGFSKSGDVGKPLAIYQTRLAQDGELLLSGSGIFRGYWRDEERIHEVMKEGWLYTGDLFECDNGRLRFVGRKEDIASTPKGAKMTPAHIENLIKSSAYITDVVVFADRDNLWSAWVEIDFEAVAEWARRNNVLHGGFISLVNRPEVYQLIRKEVMKANQCLSKEEQVQSVRILLKQLSPGSGEITPTGKIKRTLVYAGSAGLVSEENT